MTYRSNIVQGGLLLQPFRDMLLTYRPGQTRPAFSAVLSGAGTLAEYTESRRKDLLERFFVRFPTDVRDWSALTTLLERGTPQAQALALYFHTARTEALVGDFARQVLHPAWLEGRHDVLLDDVVAWVGQVTRARGQVWSESLARRVAQGLLSIARDAGLLEGVQRKRLRYPYLPDEVTLYVVLTLRAQGFTTGQRVVAHPDWQLFLLGELDVSAHLARLAEQGVLEWSATGSVYHLHVSIPEGPGAGGEVMRAVV